MRDLLIALVLAAAPTAAHAAPALAQVTVGLGATLQGEADLYGAREFPGLQEDLRKAVAARAAKGGFIRLELVLEDATPNRPTPAMLSRTANLDIRSVSRGGARITGVAYGPAGPRPIRFAWWAYDIRESAGGGIWTDAERAFALLGSELSHGRGALRLAARRLAHREPRPAALTRRRQGVALPGTRERA